jgi:hypothetical protein
VLYSRIFLMAPCVFQIFNFFWLLASLVFHTHPRSDDGRASLHTFPWEYFDSYLRVFEFFRTSSFRPKPIKLLQNANNATQHGVSDNKKGLIPILLLAGRALACWASSRNKSNCNICWPSCKLIKLQQTRPPPS